MKHKKKGQKPSLKKEPPLAVSQKEVEVKVHTHTQAQSKRKPLSKKLLRFQEPNSQAKFGLSTSDDHDNGQVVITVKNQEKSEVKEAQKVGPKAKSSHKKSSANDTFQSLKKRIDGFRFSHPRLHKFSSKILNNGVTPLLGLKSKRRIGKCLVFLIWFYFMLDWAVKTHPRTFKKLGLARHEEASFQDYFLQREGPEVGQKVQDDRPKHRLFHGSKS